MACLYRLVLGLLFLNGAQGSANPLQFICSYKKGELSCCGPRYLCGSVSAPIGPSTITSTPTPTPTRTFVKDRSETPTATKSASMTATPTSTITKSKSRTAAVTRTLSPSPSTTPTYSTTPTLTPTPTPTRKRSSSPTSTPTYSLTRSITTAATRTPTNSLTKSDSATLTSTATLSKKPFFSDESGGVVVSFPPNPIIRVTGTSGAVAGATAVWSPAGLYYKTFASIQLAWDFLSRRVLFSRATIQVACGLSITSEQILHGFTAHEVALVGYHMTTTGTVIKQSYDPSKCLLSYRAGSESVDYDGFRNMEDDSLNATLSRRTAAISVDKRAVVRLQGFSIVNRKTGPNAVKGTGLRISGGSVVEVGGGNSSVNAMRQLNVEGFKVGIAVSHHSVLLAARGVTVTNSTVGIWADMMGSAQVPYSTITGPTSPNSKTDINIYGIQASMQSVVDASYSTIKSVVVGMDASLGSVGRCESCIITFYSMPRERRAPIDSKLDDPNVSVLKANTLSVISVNKAQMKSMSPPLPTANKVGNCLGAVEGSHIQGRRVVCDSPQDSCLFLDHKSSAIIDGLQCSNPSTAILLKSASYASGNANITSRRESCVSAVSSVFNSQLTCQGLGSALFAAVNATKGSYVSVTGSSIDGVSQNCIYAKDNSGVSAQKLNCRSATSHAVSTSGASYSDITWANMYKIKGSGIYSTQGSSVIANYALLQSGWSQSCVNVSGASSVQGNGLSCNGTSSQCVRAVEGSYVGGSGLYGCRYTGVGVQSSQGSTVVLSNTDLSQGSVQSCMLSETGSSLHITGFTCNGTALAQFDSSLYLKSGGFRSSVIPRNRISALHGSYAYGNGLTMQTTTGTCFVAKWNSGVTAINSPCVSSNGGIASHYNSMVYSDSSVGVTCSGGTCANAVEAIQSTVTLTGSGSISTGSSTSCASSSLGSSVDLGSHACTNTGSGDGVIANGTSIVATAGAVSSASGIGLHAVGPSSITFSGAVANGAAGCVVAEYGAHISMSAAFTCVSTTGAAVKAQYGAVVSVANQPTITGGSANCFDSLFGGVVSIRAAVSCTATAIFMRSQYSSSIEFVISAGSMTFNNGRGVFLTSDSSSIFATTTPAQTITVLDNYDGMASKMSSSITLGGQWSVSYPSGAGTESCLTAEQSSSLRTGIVVCTNAYRGVYSAYSSSAQHVGTLTFTTSEYCGVSSYSSALNMLSLVCTGTATPTSICLRSEVGSSATTDAMACTSSTTAISSVQSSAVDCTLVAPNALAVSFVADASGSSDIQLMSNVGQTIGAMVTGRNAISSRLSSSISIVGTGLWTFTYATLDATSESCLFASQSSSVLYGAGVLSCNQALDAVRAMQTSSITLSSASVTITGAGIGLRSTYSSSIISQMVDCTGSAVASSICYSSEYSSAMSITDGRCTNADSAMTSKSSSSFEAKFTVASTWNNIRSGLSAYESSSIEVNSTTTHSVTLVNNLKNAVHAERSSSIYIAGTSWTITTGASQSCLYTSQSSSLFSNTIINCTARQGAFAVRASSILLNAASTVTGSSTTTALCYTAQYASTVTVTDGNCTSADIAMSAFGSSSIQAVFTTPSTWTNIQSAFSANESSSIVVNSATTHNVTLLNNNKNAIHAERSSSVLIQGTSWAITTSGSQLKSCFYAAQASSVLTSTSGLTTCYAWQGAYAVRSSSITLTRTTVTGQDLASSLCFFAQFSSSITVSDGSCSTAKTVMTAMASSSIEAYFASSSNWNNVRSALYSYESSSIIVVSSQTHTVSLVNDAANAIHAERSSSIMLSGASWTITTGAAWNCLVAGQSSALYSSAQIFCTAKYGAYAVRTSSIHLAQQVTVTGSSISSICFISSYSSTVTVTNGGCSNADIAIASLSGSSIEAIFSVPSTWNTVQQALLASESSSISVSSTVTHTITLINNVNHAVLAQRASSISLDGTWTIRAGAAYNCLSAHQASSIISLQAMTCNGSRGASAIHASTIYLNAASTVTGSSTTTAHCYTAQYSSTVTVTDGNCTSADIAMSAFGSSSIQAVFTTPSTWTNIQSALSSNESSSIVVNSATTHIVTLLNNNKNAIHAERSSSVLVQGTSWAITTSGLSQSCFYAAQSSSVLTSTSSPTTCIAAQGAYAVRSSSISLTRTTFTGVHVAVSQCYFAQFSSTITVNDGSCSTARTAMTALASSSIEAYFSIPSSANWSNVQSALSSSESSSIIVVSTTTHIVNLVNDAANAIHAERSSSILLSGTSWTITTGASQSCLVASQSSSLYSNTLITCTALYGAYAVRTSSIYLNQPTTVTGSSMTSAVCYTAQFSSSVSVKNGLCVAADTAMLSSTSSSIEAIFTVPSSWTNIQSALAALEGASIVVSSTVAHTVTLVNNLKHAIHVDRSSTVYLSGSLWTISPGTGTIQTCLYAVHSSSLFSDSPITCTAAKGAYALRSSSIYLYKPINVTGTSGTALCFVSEFSSSLSVTDGGCQSADTAMSSKASSSIESNFSAEKIWSDIKGLFSASHSSSIVATTTGHPYLHFHLSGTRSAVNVEMSSAISMSDSDPMVGTSFWVFSFSAPPVVCVSASLSSSLYVSGKSFLQCDMAAIAIQSSSNSYIMVEGELSHTFITSACFRASNGGAIEATEFGHCAGDPSSVIEASGGGLVRVTDISSSRTAERYARALDFAYITVTFTHTLPFTFTGNDPAGNAMEASHGSVLHLISTGELNIMGTNKVCFAAAVSSSMILEGISRCSITGTGLSAAYSSSIMAYGTYKVENAAFGASASHSSSLVTFDFRSSASQVCSLAAYSASIQHALMFSCANPVLDAIQAIASSAIEFQTRLPAPATFMSPSAGVFTATHSSSILLVGDAPIHVTMVAAHQIAVKSTSGSSIGLLGSFPIHIIFATAMTANSTCLYASSANIMALAGVLLCDGAYYGVQAVMGSSFLIHMDINFAGVSDINFKYKFVASQLSYISLQKYNDTATQTTYFLRARYLSVIDMMTVPMTNFPPLCGRFDQSSVVLSQHGPCKNPADVTKCIPALVYQSCDPNTGPESPAF